MQKFLRSTRRGWMIFNEADKGASGGSAAPSADEKPVEKPAEKPAEEKPAEKPAEVVPSAAAAQPIKPSIFARAAAMLKPTSELAATIATHEATIATHVGTIAARDKEISRLNAELKEAKDGMAELEAAMEVNAGKKAIDLAAAQGVPPVPTTAAEAGATKTDEIAALREQAAAESNPTKRAELHARANRRADSKKNSANN